MADIQHNTIVDPYIHEPKGAAAAAEGTALFKGASGSEFREAAVSDISDLQAALDIAAEGDAIYADGEGGYTVEPVRPRPGTVAQGSWKYAAGLTLTNPRELTLADTDYQLTNDGLDTDGLGTETFLEYGLPGLTNVWNTTTNKLDFYDTGVLSLGDSLDLLVEVDVTTGTTDTVVNIFLDLDADGTPFRLNLLTDQNYKSSGTYPIDLHIPFFMKTQAVLDGTGVICASADKTGATILVRGFYIRAFHTNQ